MKNKPITTKVLKKQRQDIVKKIEKYITKNKGINPLPTIQEETAREIIKLINSSNK